MHANFGAFWDSLHHIGEGFIGRLPALAIGAFVLFCFYVLSKIISRLIRRATQGHRENLGVVFARLTAAATVMFGMLVALSIIAPSFQASDLIKILGIGSVAIGFAFQNILQNFLAGLLLLWAEPFRVGDEIKIDAFEGCVEEIQARATIIKTYDERRVVIPNADLFTKSVIVNTAQDLRRWEYDVPIKGPADPEEIKRLIVDTVKKVPGVLSDPAPEALLMNLDDPEMNSFKIHVLWSTKASRQHEMLQSYDQVLTAIGKTLTDRAEKQKKKPVEQQPAKQDHAA
ncbi:MAG TPA: mechanosensitive ion channel domain-containing protein [Terriglobales bacterium]|nr:mechanosensitive ion channel domain-containing protein [Terriglobales bacterium]